MLNAVLELEEATVGGSRCRIVHAVQLIATEGESQVINQTVTGSIGLTLTLQGLDVAVLVIARHVLAEAVGVRIDAGCFAVSGVHQTA